MRGNLRVDIDQLRQTARNAMNRLAKWRGHYAGWQLGTRLATDPESQAVRDHREVTLMMRAELNALVRVLTDKNLVGEREWLDALTDEANRLNQALSERWPGAQATSEGMSYDMRLAAEWMTKWPA